MAQVINNDPDELRTELHISIKVPEEFAGFAIGEVTARRGQIIALQAEHGESTIRAMLPGSEYDRLAQAITAETLNRGRIKREPNSNGQR